MEDSRKVKVTNRASGIIVYHIPDMNNLRREFSSREEKILTFEELRKLVGTSGGAEIIEQYLIIKDKDVIKELNLNVEPEYFYEKEDVKRLLEQGSLDEFLDCLDFAPDGVLDLVKEYAVTLPLNDVAKRNALREKLDFNVDQAIQIQKESAEENKEVKTVKRRAAAPKTASGQKGDGTNKRRVVIKTEE